MSASTKARLRWVLLYEATKDAGFVCRRCGISRPTLRKWWRRYEEDGEAGLLDASRRPRRLASQKVFEAEEALILDLRRNRQLGIKQLRNELIRQHSLTLSLDTIHRVLVRHWAWLKALEPFEARFIDFGLKGTEICDIRCPEIDFTQLFLLSQHLEPVIVRLQ